MRDVSLFDAPQPTGKGIGPISSRASQAAQANRPFDSLRAGSVPRDHHYRESVNCTVAVVSTTIGSPFKR